MSTSFAVDALLSDGPAGIVAKVTVTLVVAAMIATLLRRASAAARHLVWLVGLAACVVLALLSPVAPKIGVSLGRATASRAANPQDARIDRALRVVRDRVGIQPAAASDIAAPPSARTSGDSSTKSPIDIGAMLAALCLGLIKRGWFIGALIAVTRSLLGLIALHRLARSAVTLDSPEWQFELERAARVAQPNRVPVIAMHETLSSPVTFGWRHPVILLPADASAWTRERRHVVLVHELAHVARSDFAAQFVATLACAVFWFHPLLWFAAARLRAEAEQAADDCVIAGGTAGVAYASHLLEIARDAAPLRLSAAVGMVRSSRLESRFRAMLDARRSRAGVSPRIRLATTLASLALMVPLAGLRSAAIAASKPMRRVEKPAQQPLPALSRADSTFNQTIDAVAGRRLLLDLSSGATVTIHGWNEPRVRVRGSLGGRDWRDARVSLERAGDDVRLRSRLDRESGATSISFEIWAPRRTDVEVKSAGGSLEFVDMEGEFTGQTGGGSITMSGASGHALLSTGGGQIVVMNSNLDGAITTGGGEIMMRNSHGSLTASSTTGGVVNAGVGDAIRTEVGDAIRTEVGDGIRAGVGGGSRTVVGGSIRGGVDDGIRTGVGYGAGFGRTIDNTITNSVSSDGYGTASISGGIGGGIGAGIGTRARTGFGTGFGMGVGTGVGVCSAGTSTTVGFGSTRIGEGRAITSTNTDTITNTNTTTNTNTITSSGTRRIELGTPVQDGRLSLHKAGGSIEIDDAPDGGTLSTGGGRIAVTESGGVLVASTGGGDIDLGNVHGDAVASTGAGTITIHVADTDDPEHSITVCNGHGQVVLELPSRLDARIEIETAFTDNFGRETTIDSDIPLSRSVTSDWDENAGTPRRYVRGTATVGSGRGLIRVQTVNGDVIIRRR